MSCLDNLLNGRFIKEIEQLYHAYKSSVENFAKEYSQPLRGHHYAHMTNSFLSVGPSMLFPSLPNSFERYKMFQERMQGLNTYLSLLREYPEFRESEFSSMDSFHNIPDQGEVRGVPAFKHYVKEAERILKDSTP